MSDTESAEVATDEPDEVDEPDDTDEPDDATDGNALTLVVYPDDPPKSGVWVDNDAVVSAPTEEEIAEGKRLGETIDADDDDDSGDVGPDDAHDDPNVGPPDSSDGSVTNVTNVSGVLSDLAALSRKHQVMISLTITPYDAEEFGDG
jgi:hypothetical protein